MDVGPEDFSLWRRRRAIQEEAELLKEPGPASPMLRCREESGDWVTAAMLCLDFRCASDLGC